MLDFLVEEEPDDVPGRWWPDFFCRRAVFPDGDKAEARRLLLLLPLVPGLPDDDGRGVRDDDVLEYAALRM